MIQRNPLSNTRRKQLLSRLSPTEVELLPLLAEIDPTPTGEDVPWLLKLVRTSDIRLPEDADKLNDLLITFHQNKHKLQPDQRDINRYKTHSSLYQTLKSLYPKTEDGLVLDENFRFVGEVPPYQLYEVTDRKSVQKMAKNTNWCVRAKRAAEEYLKRGPMYLILKNGEKFGAVHFESEEVMNVDDEPLDPKKKNIKKLLRLVGVDYYHLTKWLDRKDKITLPRKLLEEVRKGNLVNFFLWRNLYATGILSDIELRLFAADCAEHVLHYYEAKFSDNRPRIGIETARKFALGHATLEELAVARSAAESAVISAKDAIDVGMNTYAARWAAKSAAASVRNSAIYGARDAADWAISAAADATESDDAATIAENVELVWQQQHFLKIVQGLYGK